MLVVRLLGASALVAMLAIGCTGSDTETRAREAAEKIKESMPDVEAKAMAQKATPEDVKLAQEALTAVKEYMGEIDGKLDSVTINAIQAFQKTNGLTADGILSEKTKRLLKEALAKKG